MMPSFVFIFLLVSSQLATAAEEYKSQTTYPESAPAATTPQPPPPPPPPKPAPYVEQSAQPQQTAPPPPPAPYPQQAVPAPAPPPAPYPQHAVPAPAPPLASYPQNAVPVPAPPPAPYPQHAVPAPAPPPAPYPQHAVPAPAPYQQQPPPPPPPPHYPPPPPHYPPPPPAPHSAYIDHSAPRPAYIEHSAPPPQPQYPQQQPPQYPQQRQQHSYNAGPRTYHEEPQPYPAKFEYVDYPAPTTRRPYPYPSFEVLPHHEEYEPRSTRRPTTTEEPTTTSRKPRPGWKGDTEYNYPERNLPLKGCFYNNHGYACCNLKLQNKMEELADELLNNGTFHRCNVQKLANDLQDKVESAFKEDFETVVGLSDFAERIHFREHYVCKIEVNGRYMLAWATPDDIGTRRKRGANSTSDDIHEYNF
ncbi:Ground-like domain-containing protein [Caenorhabditis elegans]|uniref:Ground-like domain-containing protein n=1 Tax=Caenorhabditis elegans TaxID=6239 RepID=Q3Y407_CAEEL|nr:Ground-like domain-containing protein [Caenorhabditis elegans]pir/T34279/ hypothetical protein F46H5.6 - Caenorhabditis elegans [Caenorhabditis elegans]CCD71363.2 Ground-like domain-containing protein [Caenorhabditis elegans]|eukprot:NP_509224.4 GRounDhog (hedgehog-like family) [Caenorhabditis elegans]